MGKKDVALEMLSDLRKLGSWTTSLAIKGAKRSGDYIYDHREQIYEGAKIGGLASGKAVKAFGMTIYDTASLKIYSKEDISQVQKAIEEQGREYRQLTNQNLANHRAIDSLAVGGDLLHDILVHGASPEVKAAYAAAWPEKSQLMSFEDAVRHTSDDGMNALVSAVKGKLFEQKYVAFLNDGHLPSDYHAELAHAANQPGWDIAIHGPDDHIASVLQLKATDSVDYVRHALERYPDIDVVTTDEVYSHLVMNGAADHVLHSGVSNADVTQMVTDSVDGSTIHMHWDLPVISLALIAFTTYPLCQDSCRLRGAA